MTRAWPRLLALSFAAAASAAPELAVELKVDGVDFDDAQRPFIATVEVTITNRAETKVQACTVELKFLDADGKAVMVRKHALESLELAPGADTVANFEDSDPPKSWNRTVAAVAKCH